MLYTTTYLSTQVCKPTGVNAVILYPVLSVCPWPKQPRCLCVRQLIRFCVSYCVATATLAKRVLQYEVPQHLPYSILCAVTT